MTIALITLSAAGARLLAPLTIALPEARLYLHDAVSDEALVARAEKRGSDGPDTAATGPVEHGKMNAAGGAVGRISGPPVKAASVNVPAAAGMGCGRPGLPPVERFARIAGLTAALFPVCRGLVYAAPCGVVVRALAPLIRNKHEDPAVVVLDAGGRWAVSLLSGHEGGANALAIRVANLLGAEPVVTTTTEALKSVIVGIGCRRGTPPERLVAAIRGALAEAGVLPGEVRLLASADVKADEPGLLAAAEALGIPLRFIPAAEIQHSARDFSHSAFVEEKVSLPAVAEPAALLAGRRTRFISRKKIYDGITIALAREYVQG